MADITDYLSQISRAVYGKDVRQAIVDGITQCYTDGKAGSIDLTARTQIAGVSTLVTALQNADDSLSDSIAALQASVGSPLTAATAAGMTDTTKVYVYTGSETGYTNGDWYYYDGSAWQDGGVYNSVAVDTDDTLSVADMAADAAATGEKISEAQDAIDGRTITSFAPVETVFVSGGISYQTGANGANTARLRSADHIGGTAVNGYIPDNLNAIRANTGYEFSVVCYDSEGTYLGIFDGAALDTSPSGLVWLGRAYVGALTNYQIRIVVKRSDGGTITTDEAVNIIYERCADPTLTVPGRPADAREVGIIGDNLNSLLDYTGSASLHSYDITIGSGIRESDGTVYSNAARARTDRLKNNGYMFKVGDIPVVFSQYSYDPESGDTDPGWDESYEGRISGYNFVSNTTVLIPSDAVSFAVLFDISSLSGTDAEKQAACAANIVRYQLLPGTPVKRDRTTEFERFYVKTNLAWPDISTTETSGGEPVTETDVRCVIALPESYTATGTPTPLIMFGHGASCQITDSSWYGNTNNFLTMIRAFTAAGYAVFDVNNTRDQSGGFPDYGALPLMTAYIHAWEYIKENYNVEKRLYLFSDSMGTAANLNMLKWYSGEIITSIMTAPRPVCSTRYEAQSDATTKANMATAFGLSGTEWEYDRLKGFGHYENIVTINGTDYVFERFPPVKVMVGAADNTGDGNGFLAETRAYYQALANAGNYVNYREVAGATHNQMSFLTATGLRTEAVAWFDRFRFQNTFD